MRVRPFFWILLVCSCIAVLVFAVLKQPGAPAVLQAHWDHRSLAVGPTTLEFQLTDPQGLPIEHARVVSLVRMTNMDMKNDSSFVEARGHGSYMLHVGLSMAGPWSITIQASADGFLPLQKTFLLDVT